MDPKHMSGIEKIQGIIDGTLPITNMAKIIPMALTYVEDGIIKGTAEANNQHQNPSGSVHGGFAATIIDTFSALATMTKLGPGEYHSTIDLNVKMLKPVPANKLLTCEGKVINISRRLGVSDATLKDEDGKVLAYGNATFMIFRED